MAVVALKDLGMPMTNDGYRYYDEISFSPGGGVPPRPHPIPPIDPDAPHPSHPIHLPGDPGWGEEPWRPRPTHPIALPGDPWWPRPPQPGEPPAGTLVVMRPLPANVTPPTESSPQAAWVQVIMERGSPPAFARVEPYASTGPIVPPEPVKK